jgi:hypothetical protein
MRTEATVDLAKVPAALAVVDTIFFMGLTRHYFLAFEKSKMYSTP